MQADSLPAESSGKPTESLQCYYSVMSCNLNIPNKYPLVSFWLPSYHRVAKTQTRLKQLKNTHTHATIQTSGKIEKSNRLSNKRPKTDTVCPLIRTESFILSFCQDHGQYWLFMLVLPLLLAALTDSDTCGFRSGCCSVSFSLPEWLLLTGSFASTRFLQCT